MLLHFRYIREDDKLKTRYKIGVIIAALLVIIGIAGAVMIRYVFFKENASEDLFLSKDYYSKQEAEYLLINLAEQNAVLSYEPDALEEGFTAEDAGTALQVVLDMSDAQVEEVFISEQGASAGLEFLYQKKASYVLSMSEFRTLYEYMITHKDNPAVKILDLIVLDVIEEGIGADLVTDSGTTDAVDTIEGRSRYVLSPEITYTISAYTEDKSDRIYQDIAGRMDSCIRIYAWKDQILEYIGGSDAAVIMTNVWLENLEVEEEQSLRVFVKGYHKSYPCRLPEGQEAQMDIHGQLADIWLLQGKVTDIVLKSDIITSKVLAVSEDGVELENYGILKLSEHYKIYKIYGELAVEPTSQILVGYNTTNFVIADGVIEAALITEPIRAENIRVVLRNSDYSSLIHDSVLITSDQPYTLYFHDQEKVFEPGEELKLTESNGYMAEGRVTIRSNVENGTLTVTSITRNGGHPSYRGTLEIAPYDESGLIIINELSLEEYLYAVVPSEMPVSYGEVALEVQAICARGYAYMKMQDGTYAKYGAHLDDSTLTQVYHAVDETEESILAVKETYGMVPVYDGTVIQAYFFSTSCGTTCNNAEVWGGEALPYLKDKLEGYSASSRDISGGEQNSHIRIQEAVAVDLSLEDAFRAFIQDDHAYDIYEADYSFYRWSVEYSQEELTYAVNSMLEARYDTDPEKILTLQEDGSYRSQRITEIGDVVNVEVTERGISGIVKELRIEGTQAVICVRGQANARALMTPYDVVIKRQDGSESTLWSMLPSPFYYVTQPEDGYYRIYGGGFGHGVGMSQNGAKALADRGYSAEDIIRHYYTGVELVNIYR